MSQSSAENAACGAEGRRPAPRRGPTLARKTLARRSWREGGGAKTLARRDWRKHMSQSTGANTSARVSRR
eukprot:999305-Pleurochrysis_carterae.AAC.1